MPRSGGVPRIVEHLGLAHTETDLEAGRLKSASWQGKELLDLSP